MVGKFIIRAGEEEMEILATCEASGKKACGAVKELRVQEAGFEVGKGKT